MNSFRDMAIELTKTDRENNGGPVRKTTVLMANVDFIEDWDGQAGGAYIQFCNGQVWVQETRQEIFGTLLHAMSNGHVMADVALFRAHQKACKLPDGVERINGVGEKQ